MYLNVERFMNKRVRWFVPMKWIEREIEKNIELRTSYRTYSWIDVVAITEICMLVDKNLTNLSLVFIPVISSLLLWISQAELYPSKSIIQIMECYSLGCRLSFISLLYSITASLLDDLFDVFHVNDWRIILLLLVPFLIHCPHLWVLRILQQRSIRWYY